MAVEIANVMLGIRARLGDTDISHRDYSDPEILDAINAALAHLSEALLCFRRTWLIACKKGVGRYELPSDFLRLISVKYRCRVITEIESMEHRMNREGKTRGCLSSTPTLSLDLQTLHLFPAEKIEEGESIELYYHCFERVSDPTECIALPDNAKESIIYYALALLFENNIAAQGLEKSNRYRQLYQVELSRLASRVQKNAQSHSIRTTYQRI